MRVFIIGVIFGLLAIVQAGALEVSNSNDEVSVRLKTGMITEVELPEKIANVTRSVSSTVLQIETLGNKMFLLPKENCDSQIYVVTQENVSYCLRLIMDGTQAPSRIKIEKTRETSSEKQNKDTANTLEMMKALFTGSLPLGTAGSKLHPQEIFNNGKFRMVIEEVYDLSVNAKAFVLIFENLDCKPIVVPIEHIEIPGLLAISVDSQILEAKPHDLNKKTSAYTTKAYMIVERLNQ
ncbi:MAG: hypothetical protein PHS12_04650 [Candidatus Omnitrophica bacterium]|nr:hypothetical protein [Candidatus Omnitrophota bacterium]